MESLSTTTGDVFSNTTSITTLQNDVLTNLNNYTTLDIDLSSLDGQITTLESHITNIDTDITDLESDILAFNTSLSVIESDYVTNEYLDSLRIIADTTWTIGSSSDADYSSLHEALIASYNYTISPTATLTLQLEEGTHTYTDVLEINHQQGERIEIIGDIQSPETYICGLLESFWGPRGP